MGESLVRNDQQNQHSLDDNNVGFDANVIDKYNTMKKKHSNKSKGNFYQVKNVNIKEELFKNRIEDKAEVCKKKKESGYEKATNNKKKEKEEDMTNLDMIFKGKGVKPISSTVNPASANFGKSNVTNLGKSNITNLSKSSVKKTQKREFFDSNKYNHSIKSINRKLSPSKYQHATKVIAALKKGNEKKRQEDAPGFVVMRVDNDGYNRSGDSEEELMDKVEIDLEDPKTTAKHLAYDSENTNNQNFYNEIKRYESNRIDDKPKKLNRPEGVIEKDL